MICVHTYVDPLRTVLVKAVHFANRNRVMSEGGKEESVNIKMCVYFENNELRSNQPFMVNTLHAQEDMCGDGRTGKS